MKTAIVGSGFIGQAWAIVFARGGCQVKMWDANVQSLPQAHELVARQIRELESRGLLRDAEAAIARVSTVNTLEEALADVDYVQESVPERVEIKRELYARLDTLAAPDVIIASSTSSIPASAFTENLATRARCLVAHPVNPPYLIPVVELCGAPWTSADVVSRTREFMASVGQKPVNVNKEVEGFVLNRLQGALLREAFRLVESGVVSAEDLDVTVKDGLGLRWSFMGPFETIDLNAPDGVHDYCARYGGMFQRMALEQTNTDPWSDELVREVDQQRRQLLPKQALAERRLWRDDRLMALMRHKNNVDDPT